MSTPAIAPAVAARCTPGERLFHPVELGRYGLPHRMVMAPLTRSRARQPGNVPSSLNACYYVQRASAALIISEATGLRLDPRYPQPGAGRGLPKDHRLCAPERGSESFCSSGTSGASPILACSPTACSRSRPRPSSQRTKAFIENDKDEGELVPFVTPRALQIEEMPYIVRQYVRGAKNALSAGFDGVEIHAATAICSTNSSTPAPTSAPIAMAASSRTGRGC